MSDHLPPNFGSYRHIFSTAWPLVLSQMALMLLQLIDGLLLSWYSRDAIAAVAPAGLAFYALSALFIGMTSYTSTFVAQYVGARRPHRVGAVVWQGIYIALAAGLALAISGWWLSRVFLHLKHEPQIAELEMVYLRILCFGAPFTLLSCAITGFFTGRGNNIIVAAAQAAGLIANAVLDYLFIFGKFGCPEMGMAGAAWATVAAQAITFIILAVVYFAPAHRREFFTWRDWPLDIPLMRRLVAYGAPAGFRFLVEVGAWTMFTIFATRIGPDEAAATSIVLRLNGLAFFPILGLSIAIAMLVGQAQGAAQPDLAARCVWRGLAMGELWMIFAGAIFVLFPAALIGFFHDPATVPAEQFTPVLNIGVNLMYLVAIYCLVDAANGVLLSSLQGAGDTRWTLIMSAILHAFFLAGLVTLDHFGMNIYFIWGFGTLLVFAYALLWLLRFRNGKWRHMRVIEHVPEDLENVRVDLRNTL